MTDRKLDKLFVRFRKKGDTAALAQVFDATAPELLGLAVHLVRDVGEGEDLLQQTFLTAIEKADRYDADRRLVPWLVGILVRHAHAARRRRSRPEGESDADLVGGQDPRGSAEESELTDSVKDALDRLPAGYRAVLEPYLLHGERAVDIARSSGKSPGTVRVQIRRGLDELRRALPAGLAAGTGVLLSGRSLAGVRAAVLEQASRVSATSATAGATALSSTTLLGGLAMSSKFALGAIALSLLTLFGWLTQRGDAPELRPLVDSQGNLGPTPSTRQPMVALPAAPATASVAEATVSDRTEVTDEASIASSVELALAGASGRIVDEFGVPVIGVSVKLFEMRAEMFEMAVDAPFEGKLAQRLKALAWNPLVAEDSTDEEGRFEFFGAHPGGVHGLGIDLGGQRPSLRVIDRELPSGETADLGTIRLDPARTVVGQVTRFDGVAVEGARVRAAILPEEANPLAELRSGSTIILDPGREPGRAIEFPGHLSALVDQLPLPRATTDSDGRFELTGVPEREVSVYVDHPEHGLVIARVSAIRDQPAVLAFSKPISYSGRVLDTAGEGVAGARVVYGERVRDEGLVIGRGEVETDAEGGFRFECAGEATVAVHGSERSPWVVVSSFSDGSDLRVESTLEARLLLRDRDGDPIPGASVDVQRRGVLARLDSILGITTCEVLVEEVGDGGYSVSRLTPGVYRARALAPGFALHDEDFELTGAKQEVELTLDRCADHRVRVSSAENHTPIAGARVSIRSRAEEGQSITRGVTDAEGWVALSGVPVEGEHQLVLRVAHPAFAVLHQGFEFDPEGATEVELSSSNEALLRLTISGAAPLETLMVMLEAERGSIDAALPSFELTDGRGHAEFERLSAGAWRYSITPRFLHHDAMSLLEANLPEPIAAGRFTVIEGERTVVDVELSPEFFSGSQPAEGSGVEGTIVVEGIDGLELRVGLYKQGGTDLTRDWLSLPPSGQYRFDGLSPGEYQLLVLEGDFGLGPANVIASPQVEVPLDRMMTQDVRLSASTFEVTLHDEAGELVEDAVLQVYSMFGNPSGAPFARPMSAGKSRVVAWESGEYLVRATSPTAGLGTKRVQFEGLGKERFEVTLTRGVPCAGEVVMPEGSHPRDAWLTVRKLDRSGEEASESLQVIDGRATFDILGLTRGDYMGTVSFGDGSHFEVDFELPEGGDSALVLRPRADDLEGPSPAFRQDD